MSQSANPEETSPAETGSGRPVLSPEQEAEFHERGYLVVDFGFDPDLLEQVREKVNPLYPAEFHQDHTRGTRVQDAWLQVDEVRQMAVDSRVLEALQQLYGRRPLPFQTLNFPVGTSQLAHSDTIHFNSRPSGFMAGVWIALEDMDENNGALIYYPGSHKLPEYSMQDFGLGTGYGHYKAYEQAIQRIIAEQGLQPEYGIIRKGEALIWHANLLHGGSTRRDPNRSRHSQVVHYFFEGCDYFTPMLSTDEEIHYRNPVWIPESAAGVDSIRKRLSPSLLWRALRKLGMVT
ncbi:MAG: phytanoyl-CoA dioxygenase family protein [Gammaproteobacteria bacterium]|nr:phytanoyl-CoA dioxygenase family protein [Pseudomonadales bacterium]MCP5348128.1 phytanoyl-CoA dioxygenase family protein [Pseudomonadales bacterium]